MKKTQLSRRDFMRTAAGAAGAGLAVRSILLEPASLAASPRFVPPSDRLRFGIIGVGMQGSGLLRNAIQLPGVECVAACDLYDGRHDLSKEIVGKPIPTTRRYQELLDNKEIDAIICATPDHWHKQVVLDCFSAGKDVYCEKPMTHTVEQGFEIVASEQKNKRIIQVGSQRASGIIFAKAKELLDGGAIGEVSLIESTMGRNEPSGAWEYPPPPDLSPQNLDWDTWLGTAPKVPFNPLHFARWRCWQAYGSGVAGDLMVHLLTGIHYVAGVKQPPQRAQSTGGIYRWKDGRDVPDVHTVLFDYPHFRVGVRVTLSTDSDEVTRWMGSRGVLEIRGDTLTHEPQDGLDHSPSYYAHSFPKPLREKYMSEWQKEHGPKPGGQKEVEAETYHTPPGYNITRDHLWNFFQAVRSRKPVIEDATFGNNTAIACHMANASYFKNAAVEWDAVGKKIRG